MGLGTRLQEYWLPINYFKNFFNFEYISLAYIIELVFMIIGQKPESDTSKTEKLLPIPKHRNPKCQIPPPKFRCPEF